MNRAPRPLLILLLAYAAASLIHFAHNAQFLADYPNMPAWLSQAKVYVAWCGVTAVGAVGYWLLRFGHELAGLGAIALYAGLGYAGLDHYALAPVSAHSAAMNFTIWFEVATATLLLAATLMLAMKRLRGGTAS